MIDLNQISVSLSNYKQKLQEQKPLEVTGVLLRSIGLTIEGEGIWAPVGTICKICSKSKKELKAVVIGFNEQQLFLMAMEDTEGLEPGSIIKSTGKQVSVEVGDQLLGRIISGNGKPLDNLGDIKYSGTRPLLSEARNPMDIEVVENPLDVGVKAINSMLTIGVGQRIGLFAGSGVGKSVLLGMMAKYTEADVVVVGLIGERSREVKEFIVSNLGAGLKKSVVVASPADCSPVVRLHGAYRAMAIAEYFREKGKKVLFLMDSLTRFAQAQREIALAMGEPPATKGYPPSVFALLPQLVERAGNGKKGEGSITGLFTVLAEGDDIQDPIVDSARAILDGHILLSRDLADMGHFPAINVEGSISRVMKQVVTKEHFTNYMKIKKYISLYNENKDLINIGAYAAGVNADLDTAVKKIDSINNFLQQSMDEAFSFNVTYEQMTGVLNE